MGKLAYIHEVVRHARHYLTRFVSVVEAVRKLFKVLEHIASHMSLHLYAHDVTDVLYEVVEHHFHGVQQKERHAEYHNHAVVAVRYEVVEHGTRDHRIYYTDKGHAEGGEHIEREHQLMRLIVRNKSFKHYSSPLKL